MRPRRRVGIARRCAKTRRGALREKWVGVVAIGKERRRQREGFGFVPHFVARAPKRATRIERIKDDVAALRVVELAEELSRRVIDDGGIAP